MFPFRRIIVIGCCGAGKSTFSKQLSTITGLPLYHLDNLYWQPDRTHLEFRAFLKKQKSIMKTERWIIDGNYGRTMKYRMRRSDLIFFFDLPADICLQGVMKRDIRRDDISCALEPDREFLAYIESYRDVSRPQVLQRIQRYAKGQLITFYTHKDADDYLDKLKQSVIK